MPLTQAERTLNAAKTGLGYVPWELLPENSPARDLGKGAPGTHFVNDVPYAINPGALFELDPDAAIDFLYSHWLGREPDAAGLDYWKQQAANGMGGTDFLRAFKQAPEISGVTPEQRTYVAAQKDAGFPDFVKMKPGKNGPTFASDNGAVERVYAEMLGRLPSQAEVGYWSPLFAQNGMNDTWLRREVMQSPEYKQYQATGVATKTDTSNPFDKYDNEPWLVNWTAGMGGNQAVRPEAINYELDSAQRNWDAMEGRYGATSSQAWQASQDYWDVRHNSLNGGSAPPRPPQGGLGSLPGGQPQMPVGQPATPVQRPAAQYMQFNNGSNRWGYADGGPVTYQDYLSAGTMPDGTLNAMTEAQALEFIRQYYGNIGPIDTAWVPEYANPLVQTQGVLPFELDPSWNGMGAYAPVAEGGSTSQYGNDATAYSARIGPGQEDSTAYYATYNPDGTLANVELKEDPERKWWEAIGPALPLLAAAAAAAGAAAAGTQAGAAGAATSPFDVLASGALEGAGGLGIPEGLGMTGILEGGWALGTPLFPAAASAAGGAAGTAAGTAAGSAAGGVLDTVLDTVKDVGKDVLGGVLGGGDGNDSGLGGIGGVLGLGALAYALSQMNKGSPSTEYVRYAMPSVPAPRLPTNYTTGTAPPKYTTGK